jgi:hypothetical protein
MTAAAQDLTPLTPGQLSGDPGRARGPIQQGRAFSMTPHPFPHSPDGDTGASRYGRGFLPGQDSLYYPESTPGRQSCILVKVH